MNTSMENKKLTHEWLSIK